LVTRTRLPAELESALASGADCVPGSGDARELETGKPRSHEAESGLKGLAGSDFGKLIVDETEKWGKVIRAANIKPE
jgi:hypothetical protein